MKVFMEVVDATIFGLQAELLRNLPLTWWCPLYDVWWSMHQLGYVDIVIMTMMRLLIWSLLNYGKFMFLYNDLDSIMTNCCHLVENQQKMPSSWEKGPFQDLVNMMDTKNVFVFGNKRWLTTVSEGLFRAIARDKIPEKYSHTLREIPSPYKYHRNAIPIFQSKYLYNPADDDIHSLLWFAYSKISK